MELIQHWAGISFSAEWRSRRAADGRRSRKSSPFRCRPPARRIFGPVRCMALPEAGCSGPQAAGAAAHPEALRSLFPSPPSVSAPRALGRMSCLSPAPALAPRVCLVHRAGGANARPAGARRRHPVGGRAFPGKCRYTGQTHSRRIRSAPERRVFLGKPQLYKRKAGGRSSDRKACARHRCRNAPRSPCQSVWHCGKHKPCQRHDAGRLRAGSRSRSGPHWDCPRRTGRNAHFSACCRHRPGAVRVGRRAGSGSYTTHRATHRQADRAPDAVLEWAVDCSALPSSCSHRI